MRTIRLFTYLFFYFFISTRPLLSKAKKLIKKGEIEESITLYDKIVTGFGIQSIKIAGAKVKVYGKENIPADQATLFVGNHQGNYDIPLLYANIDKSIAFVSKKELGNIPFVSEWMKIGGSIFLDRENPRSQVKSMQEGVEKLKNGRSLVIFPEGTRSKGNELGEFKSGSMRLAIKSGVPIVPITIKDSYKLFEESGRAKPAEVELHFHKPIETTNEKDMNELTEKVKKVISSKM